MIDDIFLATLASELRDLAQAPALQGTAERLELERLAACVERETEVAAPSVAKTEKPMLTEGLMAQTREVLWSDEGREWVEA